MFPRYRRSPALAATAKQLIEFEKQMSALGLSMLQHQTRAAETAEAKRIDKAEQDSALSTAARSCQDAIEVALGFHAQMLGLPSAGSIVINRDFERLSLDAQEIRAYTELVGSGSISLETFWNIMRDGGALPDNFDPEVERARLDGEVLG